MALNAICCEDMTGNACAEVERTQGQAVGDKVLKQHIWNSAQTQTRTQQQTSLSMPAVDWCVIRILTGM